MTVSNGLPLLVALAASAALLAVPSAAAKPEPTSPPAAFEIDRTSGSAPARASPAFLAPALADRAATPVRSLVDRAAVGAVPVGADDLAGVLVRAVPAAGTGALVVVPGGVPAPGPGPVRSVRVEVEVGVPVDAAAFARFVLATLNDPRGWGRGGAATFARTDGPAEIVVVLASPDTSTRLCLPLDTLGLVSCRSGPSAVINHYRWVEGHPDYGGDLTGYRRYVLNHEVGHVLGHGHVRCPGPGAPAPVMQQQTFGLDGCAPNPWPYP